MNPNITHQFQLFGKDIYHGTTLVGRVRNGKADLNRTGMQLLLESQKPVKQCHGPTWGAYVDSKCATCGEPLPDGHAQFIEKQLGPDMAQELARLRADKQELVKHLRHCAKVFAGWMHDANPLDDLKPGQSADYDAACSMSDATLLLIAKHGDKP